MITAEGLQRDVMQNAAKVAGALPQGRDEVSVSVGIGALAGALGLVLQSLPPQQRQRFAMLHDHCVKLALSEIKG